MSTLYNENRKQNQFLSLEFDSRGRLNLGNQLNNQYLTRREIDILKCLLLGYTAKEIGLALGISFRTVESYINALKLKLRYTKKSELVNICMNLGLLKLLEYYSDE